MMDQAQNLRNIIKRQNVVEHHQARVLTVTSGKGGVGKSSVSLNLAIALSKIGKRVIVLDADFGLANVEVMLGIRPEYTLADLMFRGKKLTDIITVGPENIGFISGGSGIAELTNLTRDQIMNLSSRLMELDDLADLILIDTGAGISDSVMEFVTASTEVLLVATPEPTSITDAYALLKALSKRPEFVSEHSDIKLVANRVRDEREGTELYQKLNLVVDKFLHTSLKYLGAIPQDPNIGKAVMLQTPFSIQYPAAPATRAVEEMAELLVGTEEPEKKKGKGIKSLFFSVIGRKGK